MAASGGEGRISYSRWSISYQYPPLTYGPSILYTSKVASCPSNTPHAPPRFRRTLPEIYFPLPVEKNTVVNNTTTDRIHRPKGHRPAASIWRMPPPACRCHLHGPLRMVGIGARGHLMVLHQDPQRSTKRSSLHQTRSSSIRACARHLHPRSLTMASDVSQSL
jgi:hypothetical protein